jgi:hypothetical protein
MKKRAFLVPLAALTALSTSALATIDSAASTGSSKDGRIDVATKAMQDAISKSLVVYQRGEDLFALTLERQTDSTLVAQHRSHSSHSSHRSHSSHFSSRR